MATGEVTARRAVWKRLTEDPGVTAHVGDRIYYQVRPDGAAYPCIVLNVISATPRRDLNGVAWTETRIQVTAMAQTEPVAEDRKSTRLHSSHVKISYAVFRLKK